MGAPISVPAFEQGVTRVFALSLTDREARQLRDTALMQEAALGVETLDENGVEIFALSDLGELGLVGYLRDGVDVPEDDLNRDRAKLTALDGWVMVVHSSAFGGAAVTLETARTMTLIGTYGQTEADHTPIPIEAEAAQPYTGVAAPNETTEPARRGSGSLIIVLIGVVLAGAVWWALG